MIRSFANRETERLFYSGKSRRFLSVQASAVRKLQVLDKTKRLDDLRQPPGNRLKALRGEREGQYSIRINGQYRICFRWEEHQPHDVEVVGYH